MDNRISLITHWSQLDADFHKVPVCGRHLDRFSESVALLSDEEVAELLQDLQD